MLLFRKSKVLKVLREYERVYNQFIDPSLPGFEELEALRQITLQELALMYDGLEGYKYFVEVADGMDINVKYNMPDYSMARPSVDITAQPRRGVASLVRAYKNSKNECVVAQDRYVGKTLSPFSCKFVERGSYLWKQG